MIRSSRSALRIVSIATALLLLVLASLACGSTTPVVKTASPEGQGSPLTQAPPGADQQQSPQPPAPSETPKALGSARSNPAPVGSEVTVGDLAISVAEVVSPADSIVKKGNMFNPTPEPGNEYILVKISAKCGKSSDATCSLTGFEFSVIDSAGVAHDSEIMMTGVAGMYEAGEFYGGATKTGYLGFIVPKDDAGLILKYSEMFGGDAYLALK